MKITINKTLEVTPKTLRIHTKVCDSFQAALEDADGNTLRDQDDGYVPSFMPGNHYGDYLILNIDIETGQITNWNDADLSQIQEWVDEESDV